MSLSNAELISLGSFCVSIVAAGIAVRSLRNSTKALKLAEQETKEKHKGIEPYLIQARKVVVSENNFAAFAVSYTNVASLPNTIAKIELVVTYLDEAGSARQIFLQTDHALGVDIPDIKCFDVPINIPARTSMTGWLVFRLPVSLGDRTVKKYEVSGYTAQGTQVDVRTYLLMDTIFCNGDERG